MSESSKKHLLDWLRDAHAMERQAIEMLKGEQGRIDNYPELKQKLDKNLDIAHENQETLATCIKRLGGETSAIKDTGARMMGMGQALSGVVFGDEVMKAALSLYTVQNLAIASYKILATAAEDCGDMETKADIERLLAKEEELAKWLYGHLPDLTRSFMSRSDLGSDAKR